MTARPVWAEAAGSTDTADTAKRRPKAIDFPRRRPDRRHGRSSRTLRLGLTGGHETQSRLSGTIGEPRRQNIDRHHERRHYRWHGRVRLLPSIEPAPQGMGAFEQRFVGMPELKQEVRGRAADDDNRSRRCRNRGAIDAPAARSEQVGAGEARDPGAEHERPLACHRPSPLAASSSKFRSSPASCP